MSAHMHASSRMYTYMNIGMYECTYVRMHVYMYACMCACI